MKETRLERRFRNNEVAIGPMLMEFGTRGIARLLEYGDVDFVIFDMEHSGFGIDRVADLIAFLRATDIAPLVRVPDNLYHFISRALDAGALGIQVASVETAEQAARIVQSVKYAPIGHRGLAMGTAHTDFRSSNPAEYTASANARTMIVTQIETARGLANVEEIAAVEGVDVLAVGHSDLTNSLGIHGQLGHPLFQNAVVKVIDAVQKHGKIGKIHPHSDEEIERYVGMGYRMLMSPSDLSIFKEALLTRISNTRKCASAAIAGERKSTPA